MKKSSANNSAVPAPLLSLTRNGVTEITLFGEIVMVDDKGRLLFSNAESFGCYPARSVLKPFQLFATGQANRPQREQVAAACGSTSATAEQVETLLQWYGESLIPQLEKAGKLPVSFPMDDGNRCALKSRGEKARLVYHSCLSKHAAIMAAAMENHWPLDSYNSIEHPFHLRLKSLLHQWLGREVSQWVTDGCQLPSPVLSLREIAWLYARLASQAEFKTIAMLMLDYPEWVGGTGRFDTKLMQKNSRRIIAKEGADGLLAVSVMPQGNDPGVGIVVKLLSGYQPAFLPLVLDLLFAKLGIHNVSEIPKGQEGVFHYALTGEMKSSLMDLSPEISPELAVWPGDASFRRTVTLDTNSGAHLTLSSVSTTLHLGTHTDAPNHFEKAAVGMSEVELEKYIGPVQVVSVNVKPGTRVRAADFKGIELRAKRVIIRTGSSPDPRVFREDFTALSEDLIQTLHKNGVVLVGIDTPSIDLFDSKDLPAHHATTQAQMAILEGVQLEGTPDGIYELIALPLKIRDADASPVRVVLRRSP